VRRKNTTSFYTGKPFLEKYFLLFPNGIQVRFYPCLLVKNNEFRTDSFSVVELIYYLWHPKLRIKNVQ